MGFGGRRWLGPRELRALPGPSSRFPVAARLGAGRGRGSRAAAGAAQHGWPGGCERVELRGSACASEVGSPAGPALALALPPARL